MDTIAKEKAERRGNILVDCSGYVEQSLKNHGIEHVDAEMCTFDILAYIGKYIIAKEKAERGGNILVDCYGYVEQSLKNHGIEHVDAEMCAFDILAYIAKYINEQKKKREIEYSNSLQED